MSTNQDVRIKDLQQTFQDIPDGGYIPVSTPTKDGKLPANVLAKASDVDVSWDKSKTISLSQGSTSSVCTFVFGKKISKGERIEIVVTQDGVITGYKVNKASGLYTVSHAENYSFDADKDYGVSDFLVQVPSTMYVKEGGVVKGGDITFAIHVTSSGIKKSIASLEENLSALESMVAEDEEDIESLKEKVYTDIPDSLALKANKTYVDEQDNVIKAENARIEKDLSVVGNSLNKRSEGGQVFSIENDDVTWTDDKVINSTIGTITYVEGYKASGYIALCGVESITITMPRKSGSAGFGIAFYDESKTFVKGLSRPVGEEGVEEKTYNVPQGCSFIRTTFFKGNDSFECKGMVSKCAKYSDIESVNSTISTLEGKVDSQDGKIDGRISFVEDGIKDFDPEFIVATLNATIGSYGEKVSTENVIPYKMLDTARTLISVPTSLKYSIRYYNESGVVQKYVSSVVGEGKLVGFENEYPFARIVLSNITAQTITDLAEFVKDVKVKCFDDYSLNSLVFGSIANNGKYPLLSDGDSANKNRIHQCGTIANDKNYSIYVPSGHQLAIRYFNNGSVVKSVGWLSSEKTFVREQCNVEFNLFQYLLKKDDNSVFTNDEIKALRSSVVVGVEEEEKNVDGVEVYTQKTQCPTKSIRAAKEMNFDDGTEPKIDWYLIADVGTKEFFATKDFVTKKKLFTWDVAESFFNYSFGITMNGDIIAVFRTESLTDITTHSDSVRRNPHVYLAGENYTTRHEIDFGDSLKPSGWVRNTGMRVLPNGDVIFCEYTRPSVNTSNVWKISSGADLLDKYNWVVKKSFELSGNLSTGFKHCHCIMWDFYKSVVYLCTGDDNVGAQVWHSTDNGETWTQTRTASEKYCRMINFNFTDDYIYWASDTAVDSYHYMFRASRNESGIIDYNNVTEWHIESTDDRKATYGTSLFSSLGIILLNERCDGSGTALSMPIICFDLNDNTLKQISTIYSATDAGCHLGFRTDFTELYENEKGVVNYGFGASFAESVQYNYIKGFGNKGANDALKNVNTLYSKITRIGNEIKYKLGTYYV